ncbi:winged helix-turn-helix domain-containing protein [bacterium]|nr:winged helix-turn-helix domain-containing protein [bacterium]
MAKKSVKRASKVTVTAKSSLPPAEESTPRWTFLTNHSHVLILLAQDPSMVLREVALRVGITERAVQRIISDLEEGGFIEREKVGRQNRYSLQTDEFLRHPIERHRTIGDLIDLIKGK